MSRTFLISFLMVLLVGVTSPGVAINTSTIELETAVYFLSPGGDVVLVKPGTYEAEAAERWLRLISPGTERHQALLLAAESVIHTEPLNAPRALSLGGKHDIHMVALFLPDGSGLWVMGSYSGIQTRNAQGVRNAQRRFLQRKMDALRQQNKVLMQQQSDIPMNQSFNLQYLQLQQDMQSDNRQFNLLSSIMKTRHETSRKAVRNIR